MAQPLNLTKEEQDLLLDILLGEVLKINSLNSTMQQQLEQYRQDLLRIYNKLVESMDEE